MAETALLGKIVSDPDFAKFSLEDQAAILQRLVGKEVAKNYVASGGVTMGPGRPAASTPAEALERVSKATGLDSFLNRVLGPTSRSSLQAPPSATPTPEEVPLNESDAAGVLRGLVNTAMIAAIPATMGTAAGLPSALGKAAEPYGLAKLLTMLGVGIPASAGLAHLGRGAGEKVGFPELGEVGGEVVGGLAGLPLLRAFPKPPDLAGDLGARLVDLLAPGAAAAPRRAPPVGSLVRNPMAPTPAERAAVIARGPLRGVFRSVEQPTEVPPAAERAVVTPQEALVEGAASTLEPKPGYGPLRLAPGTEPTGEPVPLTGATPVLPADQATAAEYLRGLAEGIQLRKAREQAAVLEALRNAGKPMKAPRVKATKAPPEEQVTVYGSGGTGHFSTDIERAASYPGDMVTVRVPRSVFEAGQAEAAKLGQPTPQDTVLPNEWVKKAKPIAKPDVAVSVEDTGTTLADAVAEAAGEKPTVQATPAEVRRTAAVDARRLNDADLADVVSRTPETSAARPVLEKELAGRKSAEPTVLPAATEVKIGETVVDAEGKPWRVSGKSMRTVELKSTGPGDIKAQTISMEDFQALRSGGKAEPATPSGELIPGADAARARIQQAAAKLGKGTPSAGVDPQLMADYALVGADLIAKGTTDFAIWSDQMVQKYGEAVRPHLDKLWAGAQAAVAGRVVAAPAEAGGLRGLLGRVLRGGSKEKVVGEPAEVPEPSGVSRRQFLSTSAAAAGGVMSPETVAKGLAQAMAQPGSLSTVQSVASWLANGIVTAKSMFGEVHKMFNDNPEKALDLSGEAMKLVQNLNVASQYLDLHSDLHSSIPGVEALAPGRPKFSWNEFRDMAVGMDAPYILDIVAAAARSARKGKLKKLDPDLASKIDSGIQQALRGDDQPLLDVKRQINEQSPELLGRAELPPSVMSLFGGYVSSALKFLPGMMKLNPNAASNIQRATGVDLGIGKAIGKAVIQAVTPDRGPMAGVADTVAESLEGTLTKLREARRIFALGGSEKPSQNFYGFIEEQGLVKKLGLDKLLKKNSVSGIASMLHSPTEFFRQPEVRVALGREPSKRLTRVLVDLKETIQRGQDYDNFLKVANKIKRQDPDFFKQVILKVAPELAETTATVEKPVTSMTMPEVSKAPKPADGYPSVEGVFDPLDGKIEATWSAKQVAKAPQSSVTSHAAYTGPEIADQINDGSLVRFYIDKSSGTIEINNPMGADLNVLLKKFGSEYNLKQHLANQLGLEGHQKYDLSWGGPIYTKEFSALKSKFLAGRPEYPSEGTRQEVATFYKETRKAWDDWVKAHPTEVAAALGKSKEIIPGADAARTRILGRAAKLGKGSPQVGIDPQMLADYVHVGADLVARGAVDFGKWSADMIKEFGDPIKPHLRELWGKSGGALGRMSELGFYSQLNRVLSDPGLQERQPAEYWLNFLKNPKHQIKSEELRWSELEDYLKSRREAGRIVTKQDIVNFLKKNQVGVSEVRRGMSSFDKGRLDELDSKLSSGSLTEAEQKEYDTLLSREQLPRTTDLAPKYELYSLPGGQDYQEVVLRLEPKKLTVDSPEVKAEALAMAKKEFPQRSSEEQTVLAKDNLEQALKNVQKEQFAQQNTAQHFPEKDQLVHFRFTTRNSETGKKVMLVEEVQADVAQKGRDIGFKGKVEDQTPQEKALKAMTAATDAYHQYRAELKNKYKGYYRGEGSNNVERYFNLAVSLGLDNPQGRAVYAANRAANGSIRGGDMHVVQEIMRKAKLETAKKWEEHWNAGGGIKSLSAKRSKDYVADLSVPKNVQLPSQAELDTLAQLMKTVDEKQKEYISLPNIDRMDRPYEKPFIGKTQDWTRLAVRRIIRMAAEHGYDQVVFVNGGIQAKRYPGMSADQIAGQKKYYDEILPSVLSEVSKQLGAESGKTKLDLFNELQEATARQDTRLHNTPVHVERLRHAQDQSLPSVTITPQMRAALLKVGVPLFSVAAMATTQDQEK
jgi:hypothetical protein